MGFVLGDDPVMMRKMVREFAEKELAPLAAQMDIEGKVPEGILKKCAERDLNHGVLE